MRESSKNMLRSHSSFMAPTGTYLQVRDHKMALIVKVECSEKHVFSLIFYRFSLIYTAITLYLPYFALYFTLNVTILSEVQSAELIDRGEKSEFFKSNFFISKNDVSGVQEKSKNTANEFTEREIEYWIFLSTIFP